MTQNDLLGMGTAEVMTRGGNRTPFSTYVCRDRKEEFVNKEPRIAMVTGAGQGIGRAIAERLLRRGDSVVLAEYDEEAGRETEAALSDLGEVRFRATDVALEDSVRSTIQEIAETFGRLDILVNNAAIACNKPLQQLQLEEWNRVLGVNLTGLFLCAKHSAPLLRKNRGAIVNISSTRSLMSEADTEAYSASKGGINALTHALAISLAPDIRVNCISPGWIDVSAWKKRSLRREAALRPEDHAQHPAGRVGRPEDIAAMVAYLCSEQAEFITGQNFVIDGGMTKKMVYEE